MRSSEERPAAGTVADRPAERVATLPDRDPWEEGLLIRDLSVAYGRRIVLQGVSADIRRGQIVGIIGPNGGGKSTLLLAILGLVPIVGGSVTLFGRPAASLRRRIAYVPQREMVDWDFPITVREVVMMGRYPHVGWLRRPRRRDHEAVDGLLERVGLRECRDVQLGRLSGGQQQRVFLARALAQEADLLLLDEPMTGIDATTQEVFLAVLEAERRAGRIVLLATHDLVSASCACDCLCCVNERMVSFGPVRETYTPEMLAATYGGPVIMLGRAGTPAGESAHHSKESAHHAHLDAGRA